MTKVYDSFVKKNPTLFKISTLDLFVRVGFLSQDVYTSAKSAIESYQNEQKVKEEAAKSASESTSSASDANSQPNENASSTSASEDSTKDTTTIV